MPRETFAAHRTKALRALAAAAAAGALLASPLARAQSEVPIGQSPGGAEWRVGPAFGFESGALGGKDYAAAKLRVDAQRSLGVLAPNTSLDLVVSLAAFHPSGSYNVAIPVGYNTFQGFAVPWDANVFEVVAAARITRAISPRMSLFGDGGLGMNHAVARVVLPADLAALGIRSALAGGTGGVLRLAGGAVLAPTPDILVLAELVGLQLRFGDGAETGFGMLLSISHRL